MRSSAGLDAAPDEIVRVTVDATRRDVCTLLRRAAQCRGDAARSVLREPTTDLDTWFAEMDGFADVPFMDGRRQPPPEPEERF